MQNGLFSFLFTKVKIIKNWDMILRHDIFFILTSYLSYTFPCLPIADFYKTNCIHNKDYEHFSSLFYDS